MVSHPASALTQAGKDKAHNDFLDMATKMHDSFVQILLEEMQPVEKSVGLPAPAKPPRQPQWVSKEWKSTGDMPPIPQDGVRMTHFTASRNAVDSILAGDAFKFERLGIIDSTTDAYSTNDDVWTAISTGKTPGGTFGRSEFRNYVIIMDVPNTEHRRQRNPVTSTGAHRNKYNLRVFAMWRQICSSRKQMAGRILNHIETMDTEDEDDDDNFPHPTWTGFFVLE